MLCSLPSFFPEKRVGASRTCAFRHKPVPETCKFNSCGKPRECPFVYGIGSLYGSNGSNMIQWIEQKRGQNPGSLHVSLRFTPRRGSKLKRLERTQLAVKKFAGVRHLSMHLPFDQSEVLGLRPPGPSMVQVLRWNFAAGLLLKNIPGSYRCLA